MTKPTERVPVSRENVAALGALAEQIPIAAERWVEENGPRIAAAFERAVATMRGVGR